MKIFQKSHSPQKIKVKYMPSVNKPSRYALNMSSVLSISKIAKYETTCLDVMPWIWHIQVYIYEIQLHLRCILKIISKYADRITSLIYNYNYIELLSMTYYSIY